MPELPEVENVRLSLAPKLENTVITKVSVIDSRLVKFNYIDLFIKRVEGKRISEVKRRGKFLILRLEDPVSGDTENLIFHFAYVGAVLHSLNNDYSHFGPNISNHIAVEFKLSDGTYAIHSDYRTLGSVRVVNDHELQYAKYSHLKVLQQMGPEPFIETAESEYLTNIRAKRYRDKAVKAVILDQRVVAGVGNIYANEALHPAGVNPFTMVCTLSDEKLAEIFRLARDLMALSVTMGGSSIRDYVDGDGKSGTFQDMLKVYGKSTCPTCGGRIVLDHINKRPTYYCPVCQP